MFRHHDFPQDSPAYGCYPHIIFNSALFCSQSAHLNNLHSHHIYNTEMMCYSQAKNSRDHTNCYSNMSVTAGPLVLRALVEWTQLKKKLLWKRSWFSGVWLFTHSMEVMVLQLWEISTTFLLQSKTVTITKSTLVYKEIYFVIITWAPKLRWLPLRSDRWHDPPWGWSAWPHVMLHWASSING